MCSTAPKTCSFSKCIMPLVMGGLHSGTIMLAGDLMAQTFIESSEVDARKIDWERTAKFGAIGFLYVGPVIRFWNGIMARYIPRRGAIFEKAFNRTFSTQLYLAPTLNLGIIALSSLAKEEKLERNIVDKSFQRDLINIMEKNYILWPITQFLCTPLQDSLKFVALTAVSVLWSAFLSTVLMGGNSSKTPEVKSFKGDQKAKEAPKKEQEKGKTKEW